MSRVTLAVLMSLMALACSEPPSSPTFSKNSKAAGLETSADSGQKKNGKQDGRPNDGQDPDANASPGVGDDSRQPSKPVKGQDKPMRYTVMKLDQDGADFTFAKLQITLAEKIEGTGFKRYAYDPKAASIKPDQKEAIAKICETISFQQAAGGLATLSWRSYFSDSVKKKLVEAGLEGHTGLLCVLELGTGALNGRRYLVFDPMPSVEENLVGAVDKKKMVRFGLMSLLKSQTVVSLEAASLIELGMALTQPLAVRALNGEQVKIDSSLSPGEECWYNAARAMPVVGDPNHTLKMTQALSSSQPFRMSPLVGVPLNGKLAPSCGKLNHMLTNNSLTADISCGLYHAIKAEGSEASCQWSTLIENTDDPENAFPVFLGMNKMPFRTVSFKDWKDVEKYRVIPEHGENPVRRNTIKFQGFSSEQLKSAEIILDVLLSVSPDLTRRTLLETIKTMIAETASNCSNPQVGGFAQIGGDTFYWCQGWIVSKNVFNVAIAGQIIIHESLHAMGRYHDIDRKDYPPCAGTANSALLGRDLHAICNADFCPALKPMADALMFQEMSYSLANDDRRFQGACKDWQNDMGLTDNQIRNSKR